MADPIPGFGEPSLQGRSVGAEALIIVMYTHGSGSGHLTRINAVYRGLERLGRAFSFHLVAPRSNYLNLRLPGITLVDLSLIPERIDLFICDWRYTEELGALSRDRATRWFALCRLGTIPRRFPDWFDTVAIEPNVRANHLVWPIISTFSDEMLCRSDARKKLGLPDEGQCVFVFENGSYAKHVETVFTEPLPSDAMVVRSSLSRHASGLESNLQCYPIAPYLRAADLIITGAGYNATHELRALAPTVDRRLLAVGGDDQKRRIELEASWPSAQDSAAISLAELMTAGL